MEDLDRSVGIGEPIMDDNETEIKPLAQVKQRIGLLFGPAAV